MPTISEYRLQKLILWKANLGSLPSQRSRQQNRDCSRIMSPAIQPACNGPRRYCAASGKLYSEKNSQVLLVRRAATARQAAKSPGSRHTKLSHPNRAPCENHLVGATDEEATRGN